jgi:4-hydroxy-2-oxoheptanedioate aldolase
VLANRIKQSIEAGAAVHGVFLPFPSADMAEFLGHAGFDYLMIDGEHGPFELHACTDIVRASLAAGMVPFVRVRDRQPGTILGYLETGVFGILVPNIDSAEDAAAAVAAARYSPLGRRGAGSATRAAHFGLTQTATEYFSWANREIMVVGLIESELGIKNIDEILAVDGLDAVGLGPGDLAMSLGLPGRPDDPKVRNLIASAEPRVLASRKALLHAANTPEDARAAVERGALLTLATFGPLFGRAVRRHLEILRVPVG